MVGRHQGNRRPEENTMLKKLFRQTKSSRWTISGNGSRDEKRILGVWFYRRQRVQKWAPLMHEVEEERGVRIGHVRISISFTNKLFFDGKEPRKVAGDY